MYFKKERAIDNRLNREHGWIEALDVADLENPGMLPGRPQERVRVSKILCHRLFDENIHAQFHQAAADFRVGNGWNGYAYRINVALHRFQRRERLRVKFLRERRGACCIRIEHSRELCRFHFAVDPRVIPPEFTATGNGHTYAPDLASGPHRCSIPLGIEFGSTVTAGGKAWIAIPAWFAAAMSASRSKSSVSQRATAYPASSGRQVFCGIRQSIPSMR